MRWAFGIASFCLALAFGAPTPAKACGFLEAWSCCDQWGYDYPGFYWTKDSCTDNGGLIECGNFCSNQSLAPFKCCDAQGYPFPGVYSDRHSCKIAGGEVFSNWLFCPNASDVAFRCCDPDGGSAPGVYSYREDCRDAGYFVKEDYDLTGCPGGLIDNLKETFKEIKNAKQCTTSRKKHYAPDPPDPDAPMSQWALAYNAAQAAITPPGEEPETWSDKDSHCTLSCLLTVECGRFAATLAGWYRELSQMCDGKPFNSWGWGDECANRIGRQYGVDLDEDLDDYQTMCREYCLGIDDLESQCAGIGGMYMTFLEPVASQTGTSAEDLLLAEVEELKAELGEVYDGLYNACEGLFGGLTADVAGLNADTLHAIKTQGLALIAETSTLDVGDVGTFDDAAVSYDAPGEHSILLNVPGVQRDAYLKFKDQALESMELRSAAGYVVVITAADTIQTSCAGGNCERRLPWLQWRVTPEPTQSITP